MTSQNRREARRNLKGHENRIIEHCAKSKFCAKRNRSKIYGLPLSVSSTIIAIPVRLILYSLLLIT